jgi:uncharacterized protein (DUF1778 family)
MTTDATEQHAPRTVGGMAGKIDRGRDSRLELRMTPEEKALIEEAARLGGEDTSQFARRVALLEARSLLARMKK